MMSTNFFRLSFKIFSILPKFRVLCWAWLGLVGVGSVAAVNKLDLAMPSKIHDHGINTVVHNIKFGMFAKVGNFNGLFNNSFVHKLAFA